MVALALSKFGELQMVVNRTKPRIDVSHSKNAWQVSIIVDDHSEHRSFRTEAEAREYAQNRMEKLQAKTEIRSN